MDFIWEMREFHLQTPQNAFVAALLIGCVALTWSRDPPELQPSPSSSPSTNTVALIASITPTPQLPPLSKLSYSASCPLRLPPLHLNIFNPSAFHIAIAHGILLTICIKPSSSYAADGFYSTEACLQWLHPLNPSPPPSPTRPFFPQLEHDSTLTGETTRAP
jgi:hypothetical protein